MMIVFFFTSNSEFISCDINLLFGYSYCPCFRAYDDIQALFDLVLFMTPDYILMLSRIM